MTAIEVASLPKVEKGPCPECGGTLEYFEVCPDCGGHCAAVHPVGWECVEHSGMELGCGWETDDEEGVADVLLECSRCERIFQQADE